MSESGWDLQVHEGRSALILVADAAFRVAWSAVAERDPKSTWCQEPFFVSAWYQAYASTHEPLLLVARDAHDRVVGIMALARGRDGRGVVHAGDHQAEYHGWIADPAVEGAFPRRCVEEVFRRYRPPRWAWRYLPPRSPVAWIDEACGSTLPAAARTSSMKSPVWDVTDGEVLRRRSRGRGVRGHVNRYRQRGDLVFERLLDPERALDAVDVMAPWYDLRQGATHGDLPFREDPAKMPFHRALATDAREVQVGVLRLDDRPLAVHLGGFDGDELIMGVQGYDPREGRRSPGTILLVEMAQELSEQGATTLDLTPGGDAWKERYATAHRTVHRVTFFGSRTRARIVDLRSTAGHLVRDAIRRSGREPAKTRAALLAAADRFRGRRRAVESSWEILDLTPDPGPHEATDPTPILLDLAVAAADGDTSSYLSSALSRLHSGWTLVSCAREGVLRVLAWVAPPDARARLTPEPAGHDENSVVSIHRGAPDSDPEETVPVPDGVRLVQVSRIGDGVLPEDLDATMARVGAAIGAASCWVLIDASLPVAASWTVSTGCQVLWPSMADSVRKD